MKKKRRTKRTFLAAVLFLSLFGAAKSAYAATYYINAAGGNNSNAGTSPELAWATIGKANTTLSAGDTVFVSAGTYNEAISPANSGGEGSFITYAAKAGETPVIRQAALSGDDYIRVIGFEITHSGTGYTHAVTLYGTDHCEILNNNIHHINGQGIRNNDYYGNSNYNVIRGNTFSWIGCPSDAPGSCSGGSGVNLRGHHNLIEYNEMSHTLDFIDTRGSYTVIRNNYLHDFENTDFPDGTGDGAHVDIFQPYGIPGEVSDRNVFENNWSADNLENNSHYFQVRDENVSGEKEFIIRGNVGTRMGSYVAQFGAIDFTRVYNNTFLDFAYGQGTKSNSTISYTVEPPNTTTDPSVNNFNFNNIYYKVSNPSTGTILYVSSACSVQASNNACEQSGTHASCGVTSNINFSNYAGDDFHLQSSSSARSAGKPITTVTSGNGNGTVFAVADAGFFTDGYEITEGDLIRVGSGNPARITGVDYGANTITVTAPISWNTGDAVVLSHQDASPDIGAFEYKQDGYSLSGTWSKAGSTVTVAPNDASLVRFVEVFENSVPVGKSFAAPWSVSGVGGGTVTAKIYSLFADQSPVVNAAESSQPDGTPPAAPAGLTIQ